MEIANFLVRRVTCYLNEFAYYKKFKQFAEPFKNKSRAGEKLIANYYKSMSEHDRKILLETYDKMTEDEKKNLNR